MLLDTATPTPEPTPPRDNPAPRPAATDKPATSAAPEKAPATNDANDTVTTSDAPQPVNECAAPDCKLPLNFAVEVAVTIETPEDTKESDAVPMLPEVPAELASDGPTAVPEMPQLVAAPVPMPALNPVDPQRQVEAIETPEAAAIEGMEAAAEAPKPAPLQAEAPDQDAPEADTPKADAPPADAPKAATPKIAAPKANPLKTEGDAPQAETKPAAETDAAPEKVTAPPSHPHPTKPAPKTVAPEHRAVDAMESVPAPHASEVAVKVVGALQSLGLASAAHATASVNQPQHASAPTATTPDTVTVPVAGLAVAIAAQAQAGKSRFEIRLDPPELGRIDVRLDIDRDGNVASRLVVERQDTLDLLRRDASQLERALQQAGLKTSDNALEFSLRGHAFGRDHETRDLPTQLIIPEDDAAPLEALRQGYGKMLGLGGGIDIRV